MLLKKIKIFFFHFHAFVTSTAKHAKRRKIKNVDVFLHDLQQTQFVGNVVEIIANDISYDFGYICDCCGPIEGVAIKFLVFIQRWIIIMTLQLSNSSYFDDK